MALESAPAQNAGTQRVKGRGVALSLGMGRTEGGARLEEREDATKGDRPAVGADMGQALARPSPTGLLIPEDGESSLSSGSMAHGKLSSSLRRPGQGNREWRHKLEVKPVGPGWENPVGENNPRGNHEFDGMNLSGCPKCWL